MCVFIVSKPVQTKKNPTYRAKKNTQLPRGANQTSHPRRTGTSTCSSDFVVITHTKKTTCPPLSKGVVVRFCFFFVARLERGCPFHFLPSFLPIYLDLFLRCVSLRFKPGRHCCNSCLATSVTDIKVVRKLVFYGMKTRHQLIG